MIADILARFGKAKYFTSLDLKSGYWQVLMNEADKEKTAFACHRLNVIKAFGLSNAPAVHLELISVVLQGLGDFAIAILAFSPALEDHLKHLDVIFGRLRKHDLGLLEFETNYLVFLF